MANMAQYLADQLLNWLKGTNVVAASATLYLGLFTSSSTLNTSGTECTGGSYARKAITTATGWAAISTLNGRRQISNNADLAFVTATADWAPAASPVVGWELRDAASAGNRVAYGNFDTPFAVLNGQTATVLNGTLVLSVS